MCATEREGEKKRGRERERGGDKKSANQTQREEKKIRQHSIFHLQSSPDQSEAVKLR